MEKRIGGLEFKFKKLWRWAILVLIVILLASTVKNINRVISIQKQVEDERQKVEKIEAENKELEAKIAEAQGSEYIEKQIRDKLGLARSGEAIVVLPDKDIIRGLAPTEDVNVNTLPDPNWVKWKKLFF